jgi:hypothetical protein
LAMKASSAGVGVYPGRYAPIRTMSRVGHVSNESYHNY